MSNPYFQFRRVDRFNRDKNRKDCFDVEDMNGVDLNYKLVLASQCPTSIEDCLDADGTLNDKVVIFDSLGDQDGLVALLYNEGINGEETISLNTTSVTYEMTDETDYVQGIFLVSYGNGSGYVMAYSINNVPLKVIDDTLILNTIGLIWGLRYGGE